MNQQQLIRQMVNRLLVVAASFCCCLLLFWKSIAMFNAQLCNICLVEVVDDSFCRCVVVVVGLPLLLASGADCRCCCFVEKAMVVTTQMQSFWSSCLYIRSGCHVKMLIRRTVDFVACCWAKVVEIELSLLSLFNDVAVGLL